MSRFKFLCNECQEPLVYVDKFKVCPRGHGRLIPTTRDERSGPEYESRRIVQSSLLREIGREIRKARES